jgi:accessory gene regulator B
METLARKWAHKIAFELKYDDEKEQVVAYGMIALVQIVITTFMVAVLGFLFKVPLQALLLCWAVSLLRKYSGGAHLQTMEACTLMSIILSLLLALLATHILPIFVQAPLLLALIFIVYGLAFFICLKKAPVDNANKPIRTAAKRKRMKKYTMLVLFAYFIISIILFVVKDYLAIFSALNFSLLLAVIWQVITLTNFGKYTFSQIDKLNRVF